jgi:hypothetical protein
MYELVVRDEKASPAEKLKRNVLGSELEGVSAGGGVVVVVVV